MSGSVFRTLKTNPPKLHRAIGTVAACGLKLDSQFDRTWRHPRLPGHARSYWNGHRVIWASAIVEDVTCAKCREMPK